MMLQIPLKHPPKNPQPGPPGPEPQPGPGPPGPGPQPGPRGPPGPIARSQSSLLLQFGDYTDKVILIETRDKVEEDHKEYNFKQPINFLKILIMINIRVWYAYIRS